MPYGYEDFIDLTPGQILQKVSQQQIFELILQQPFSFNKQYISPLRTDDTAAGCRFEQRPDGTILWVDFADNPTHRTCFKMMMDKTGHSLDGVIRLICIHFKLSTNKEDYQLIDTRPSPFLFEDTSKTEMRYDKREYTRKDILYWAKFITKTQHLLEDNVFAASRIYIHNHKKEKPTSFSPMGLCYVIDFLDAIKVYQPYSSTHRWITNCNANHIGNFDNLPLTGNTLIITKAYKDHRVFRNVGLDDAYSVVWFFNEGAMPNDYILGSLLARFIYIIIFYDNDEQGIKAATILMDKLNSLRRQGGLGVCMTYVPKGKYKDIGEFIEKEGQRDTLKLLDNLL